MRLCWRASAALGLCGVVLLATAVVALKLRHSRLQAEELLQELARLQVGISGETEVHEFETRFDSYRIPTRQSQEMHWVTFQITNRPAFTLKLQPFARLTAGIGIREGKVVIVEAELERQVGRNRSQTAIVWESIRQSRFCEEPYCVGNPIGKPFILASLDGRATRQQRERAFDLNLSWLTRFRGDPRICDLSPNAWEDWKAQKPDDVAALRQTYHCP